MAKKGQEAAPQSILHLFCLFLTVVALVRLLSLFLGRLLLPALADHLCFFGGWGHFLPDDT